MRALLEVVILPVADADRSLHFYRDLVGFELDVDYAPAPDFRVVQLTPHGSGTSIQFGVGLQDTPAGSVRAGGSPSGRDRRERRMAAGGDSVERGASDR